MMCPIFLCLCEMFYYEEIEDECCRYWINSTEHVLCYKKLNEALPQVAPAGGLTIA